MFHLTSHINIGEHQNVKPAKVTWKTSVNSFTDTCTIELPRVTFLRTVATTSEDIQSRNGRQEYAIKEDDQVEVHLGYDRRNHLRFKGFVRRVNETVPVQIECEGYSYLLQTVMFNKSYASVTVRQLLLDVCQGTAIKVSADIPDIPLKNVRFKNATGIQVLEWLQKECQLAVYFNFDELFAGTLYGKATGKAKLRLGWNTVKEDDFKRRQVDRNVKVVVKEKDQKGKTNRVPSDAKYSNEKAVKVRAGIPSEMLKQIANRLQTKSNYQGYQGNVVAFLEPLLNKGMAVEVDGGRYPDKSGLFLVESVQGEFGRNGGRQTVELNYLMS